MPQKNQANPAKLNRAAEASNDPPQSVATTHVATAPTDTEEIKPARKIDQIVTLLRRDQGATLAELHELTGWLPHTTRAAISRLRKGGHQILREKRERGTIYHVKASN